MLPGLRVFRAHTGGDFEGDLVNRNRGEVLPGVDVVDARESPAQATQRRRGTEHSGASQDKERMPPVVQSGSDSHSDGFCFDMGNSTAASVEKPNRPADARHHAR
jgi:hypothetical protein